MKLFKRIRHVNIDVNLALIENKNNQRSRQKRKLGKLD